MSTKDLDLTFVAKMRGTVDIQQYEFFQILDVSLLRIGGNHVSSSDQN